MSKALHLMPECCSLESQSNRSVQVVKTNQSEDNTLYIDDLKVFGASESKLLGVLRSVKVDMECLSLKWKGKCAVAQRVSDSRCEDRTSESTKFDSFKKYDFVKSATETVENST